MKSQIKNKKGKLNLDLNELAFEILKSCRTNKKGTIAFKEIWLKLCTRFSIKKQICRELLKDFERQGKIKFVTYRGIKVIEI